MMGMLLRNRSAFAGATNPTFEVFPLLLAPCFCLSFKAPCAAQLIADVDEKQIKPC